jgi:PA-IL-like protein
MCFVELKGKRIMRKIILALIIVLAAASFAVADTVYLRDGRTIQGTLLGFINGRFVVRVESRYSTQPANPDSEIARRRANEGEIQYFRPEEVERIEIEGRSIEDTRMETSTVQVTLESNWIDSGINLRRNQRVQISASGLITAGRTRITPDGLRSTDPNSPLPSSAEGMLIGAVGDDRNAPILELGSSREFTTDRAGRLYLTANRGSYTDARGSFTVQIKRERGVDSAGDLRPGRIRSRDRQPIDQIDRTRRPEVTINVPGTSRGTDTGIDVRAGDAISFTATGVIIAGSRVGQVGPDGATSTGFGSAVNARPVPSAGVGALIAYIRMSNGQLSTPYLIGSHLDATVPVDGRLILLINDDNYGDNSGSFSVRIRY